MRDGDRTGIAKAYNNLALLWRMQGKEVIARASDAGTADTVEVLAEARRNFERANEYLIKYLDLMREFKNRYFFVAKGTGKCDVIRQFVVSVTSRWTRGHVLSFLLQEK